MLVGDRREDGRALPHEAHAKRRSRDLEGRVAVDERPQPRAGLRCRACAGAAHEQSVIRTGIGAEAHAKRAARVRGDLEHVAGRRREGRAGARRAEAALNLEAQVRGGI